MLEQLTELRKVQHSRFKFYYILHGVKHEKTELPRPALHGVRRISVVRSSPESQYPEFFFVFCLFFIFSLRAVGERKQAERQAEEREKK